MQREVKQKAYLSPEVTVCTFAPEQGFALSTVTEDYGSSVFAAESYGETEHAAEAEGYESISFF